MKKVCCLKITPIEQGSVKYRTPWRYLFMQYGIWYIVHTVKLGLVNDAVCLRSHNLDFNWMKELRLRLHADSRISCPSRLLLIQLSHSLSISFRQKIYRVQEMIIPNESHLFSKSWKFLVFRRLYKQSRYSWELE